MMKQAKERAMASMIQKTNVRQFLESCREMAELAQKAGDLRMAAAFAELAASMAEQTAGPMEPHHAAPVAEQSSTYMPHQNQ